MYHEINFKLSHYIGCYFYNKISNSICKVANKLYFIYVNKKK